MSKFTDLRKQNPDWDVNLFDLIKYADPSDTNRYAAFILKCIKQNFDSPGKIVAHLACLGNDNLKQFHQWYEEGLVEKKDILQYKNADDFHKQYKKAKEKADLREMEKKTRKLYESSDWVIVVPESYEAATVYGKGTKWCITQKTHWNNYMRKHFFIMCICKTNKERYCYSKDVINNKVQCWDAEDKELSNPFGIPIPFEAFPVVFKELNECFISVQEMMESNGDAKFYWETADGKVMEVGEMSTTHINNILKQEWRFKSGDRKRSIEAMKRELKRREQGKPEPNPARTLIQQILDTTRNFNEPNANGHVYPQDVMQRAIDEYTEQAIQDHMYGQVDHPDPAPAVLAYSPSELRQAAAEVDTDRIGNIFDRINELRDGAPQEVVRPRLHQINLDEYITREQVESLRSHYGIDIETEVENMGQIFESEDIGEDEELEGDEAEELSATADDYAYDESEALELDDDDELADGEGWDVSEDEGTPRMSYGEYLTNLELADEMDGDDEEDLGF